MSTVISQQLKDIQLNTILDTGFFSAFTFSPAIHSHPCYEFIAAVSGEFHIETLSGEPIKMTPGKICLIPPGLHHGTIADGEDAEKLAVRFSYCGRGAETEYFDLFDGILGKITSPIIIDNGEKSVAIMKKLRDELCSNRLCGEVIVEAMLTEFYIETLRLICRGAENESREKSEAVVDSVHNRYYNIEMWFGKRFSENVTEEDLARELNLSKRQLSRNLREIYGMSFREKLCDVRVHNAVKLLTQTDSSVERIAAMVGYESPSGLYRAFERQLGMKISEFRAVGRCEREDK